MVASPVKMDPEGHEPSGKSRHDNDPSISTNKHLTRLVRFSILQARRSSHASKLAQQQQNNKALETTKQAPSPIASSPPKQRQSPKPQINNIRSPRNNAATDHSKLPFHLGGFTADKERPSTEVQYEYNDAPGHVGNDIGVVVDVPADPPMIQEDLSASLTISVGDHSAYSGSLSEEAGGDEAMAILLAPDSGEGRAVDPSSSNEIYNSAEMYSSSGDYDASDHSGSDSSDSIMRRVEEEIANARKASNDAQARLAYFTQKQKELTPVMTDSYSFDFDNLETSGQLQNMLDIGDGGVQRDHRHLDHHHQGQRLSSPDENYNNAMGVIGKEFDGNSIRDVVEKVDIEVVLAPPPPVAQIASPRKQSASPYRSPAYNRRSPRGPKNNRNLRHRDDDSVDIDEAVIEAVFSEKSIESLPVKESLPAVFSEQSMESLPTQHTQSSIALSSFSKPASYAYQDASISDFPLSPGSQKRNNKLPAANKITSPSQMSLSIQTDGNFAAKSAVSPLASSPSKLPPTPREPNTPSYRERLENKLKILGSRYPASPSTKGSTTPTSKKEFVRRGGSISPSKAPRTAPDMPAPSTPKDTIMSPANMVGSPLGEAYDGLENRIKDLLARTLNPGPSETSQAGEKGWPYQSSPSAELKAIKQLLEQGVAAAAAAEEKKRGSQGQEDHADGQTGVTGPTPLSEQKLQAVGQGGDLNFPVLEEETTEDQSQLAQSKSQETNGSSSVDRLPMRSIGLVPPVMETAEEEKDAQSPTITGSTSEDILEALDSFSQSTEFKTKSRKGSSSPRKPPKKQDENDLNDEVQEKREEGTTSETLPAKSPQPPSPEEKEHEEPKCDKAEHCSELKSKQKGQAQEVPNVEGKETEEVGAMAEHSNSDPAKSTLQVSNEPNIDAPPEEEDMNIPVNDDLDDSQHDEKSDYESCVENSTRDDDRNEVITTSSTTDSKAEIGQEYQSAGSTDFDMQTPAKKTPSVLNAALSRPALTSDLKDRRSNERKVRQKATTPQNGTDEEQETEHAEGVSVVLDSSAPPTTVEESHEREPPQTAIASEEITGPSSNASEAGSHHPSQVQSNGEPINMNQKPTPEPAVAEPEHQSKEADRSGGGEQRATHTRRK